MRLKKNKDLGEKIMIEKAIEKLESEMNKINNPYVQVVGQFLIQYVKSNQGDAEKIVLEGKTITKSLDEMRKAAEKKKVGNCAVLTDQEGFEIVLKYFGIDGQAKTDTMVHVECKTVPEIKPKAAIDFDISLDDFI